MEGNQQSKSAFELFEERQREVDLDSMFVVVHLVLGFTSMARKTVTNNTLFME